MVSLVRSYQSRNYINLVPETKTRFVLPETAGTVDFAESAGIMTFRLFVAETVVEGTRLK